MRPRAVSIALARELLALRRLPRPVALLYVRCLALALRLRDTWSLRSAIRPYELAQLIDTARGRRRVVELGTGTAWTALALAAADRQRRVETYDPNVLPMRDRYLSLLDSATRTRIDLVEERGEVGPREPTPRDMVFIDSWHSQEVTSASFRAWEPVLRPGGIAAFHDYGPVYPGVADAIEELGLEGVVFGNLFVWEKPTDA